MSQAIRKRPSADRKLILTGLRELLFISFCFVGLYLFVSLVTYYPLDPSLFHDNTGIKEVHNKGGFAGAIIADLFFNLFGYSAYLFAYLVILIGWIIYKDKHQDMLAKPKEMVIPTLGFVLTLSAACGLFIVHFAAESALLPSHAGGMLGNLVGKELKNIFSQLGATLILLAVFFTGVTMLTGLSWLRLMDILGYHSIHLYKRLLPVVQAFFTQRALPVAKGYTEHAVDTVKHTLKTRVPIWRDAVKDRVQTHHQQAKRRGQEALDWWQARRRDKTPAVAEEPWEETVPAAEPVSEPEPPAEVNPVAEVAPTRGEEAIILYNLPTPDHLEQPAVASETNPDLKPVFMRVQVALQKINPHAKVKGVYPGPVLHRVEIKPAETQTHKEEVVAMAEQLIQALGIPGIQVLESTPAMLSLELPGAQPKAIYFGELIRSEAYHAGQAILPLALGKDARGMPVITDLERMPHLLLTGSNVADVNRALHGIILSLLYKLTANEMRLVMLDSAHKSLSHYANLPHLLTPITRDIQEILQTFRWCVSEIERRYHLMAELRVRNIEGYNRKILDSGADAETLPYIVVVAHEIAEMFAENQGKAVEDLLIRIAQKARAAGIHLVLATQQPSTEVISAAMKNNFPTRAVFRTANRNESRIVLGIPGAETLLGNGDMFYLTPGTGTPARVHGAQITLEEVGKVTEELKRQGEPRYETLSR